MTRYLVDTNVVSELVKVEIDGSVDAFVRDLPVDDLFVSAISVFEIETGLSRLPAGRRRQLIERRYAYLLDAWDRKVLGVGAEEAEAAARIAASARQRGESLDEHVLDLLIAATATIHALTVMSRNESQFMSARVPFVNPWR